VLGSDSTHEKLGNETHENGLKAEDKEHDGEGQKRRGRHGSALNDLASRKISKGDKAGKHQNDARTAKQRMGLFP